MKIMFYSSNIIADLFEFNHGRPIQLSAERHSDYIFGLSLDSNDKIKIEATPLLKYGIVSVTKLTSA